jgi:hypothetical protein
MLTFANQAVHENKLARGPAHGFDNTFIDLAPVVKQGHVRRETRCRIAFKPCLLQRRAKNRMKLLQRGNVASKEDEWAVTRFPAKTACMVEYNVERRHRDSCRSRLRPRGNVPWETWVCTDGMQRDVEALRAKQLSFQAMFSMQLSRKPLDTRGSVGIRQDREEQMMTIR